VAYFFFQRILTRAEKHWRRCHCTFE